MNYGRAEQRGFTARQSGGVGVTCRRQRTSTTSKTVHAAAHTA